MKIQDIVEARRNPELNVKAKGHAAAVEYLKKYGVDNTGISMTKIPKLGLNPKSKFDTPVGIYFYPARYYLERVANNKQLPFQHDAPYIQVFTYPKDAKVLDLGSFTEDQYDRTLDYLIEKLDYYDADVYEFADTGRDGEALVDSPGGWLWYVLWNLAEKDPIKWNKLLRDLGYDVVLDNGTGTIHKNEPTQGIVVNPRVVQHLEQFQQSYNAPNYAKALQIGKIALSDIPKDAITSELATIAVQRDPHWLASVPVKLITPELADLAVSQDGSTIQLVPQSLRTLDLLIKAAENLPKGIRHHVIDHAPPLVYKQFMDWYNKTQVKPNK